MHPMMVGSVSMASRKMSPIVFRAVSACEDDPLAGFSMRSAG